MQAICGLSGPSGVCKPENFSFLFFFKKIWAAKIFEKLNI
jgi:hypothetical protein